MNNGHDVQDIAQYFGRTTRVFGNRAVNEVSGGWSTWYQEVKLIKPLTNPNAKFPGNGPQIILAGMTVGGLERWPTVGRQTIASVRDDLTLFYDKHGRHTVKVGGDYLWQRNTDIRCTSCDGVLTANLGPIPANIGSLFPDPVQRDHLEPDAVVVDQFRVSAEFRADQGTVRQLSDPQHVRVLGAGRMEIPPPT